MTEQAALTVIVTGAGRGLGKLIAQTLAGRGNRVFATMRDIGGKNANAARELIDWGKDAFSLEVLEMDVTSDTSVKRAVKNVIDAAGAVDVVVNNAGAFAAGILESYTTEQAKHIFDVNTFGSLRVNNEVVPAMRLQGSGLLIHISSAAARMGTPFAGIYSASKAALEAIVEAYSFELKSFGIEMAMIEPGAYPTDQQPIEPENLKKMEEYGSVAESCAKLFAGFGQILSSPGAPNPQEVADAVHNIIDTPVGQRPLRTVVGSIGVDGIEELNEIIAARYREYLKAMGV